MRKKVTIIAAIAVCTLGYFQVQKVQSKESLTDIELMNIEALAYGSETTGYTVDYYSESDHKRGATYYDCGDCSKQFNQNGVGSQRTCQLLIDERFFNCTSAALSFCLKIPTGKVFWIRR